MMEINSIKEKINRELDSFNYGDNPSELYEPLRYITSLGGKRLRPILAVLAYQCYRNDDKAIRPSLALELFHNFSLIHDDIMDEAPIRRGKETVHTKWNTSTAILSGDVMLVRAYDLLLECNDQNLHEAVRYFNKCAAEVCEGQQIDMNFEKRSDVEIQEYLEMIRLKTAVLLGYSLRLGALLGGANREEQDLFDKFGQLSGIGFQLRDDYLDAFAEETFGKQKGGDIISNKKTYLTLLALEKANESQKHELLKWFSIEEFDAKEKVNAVLKIYRDLEIDKETNRLIRKYFSDAFEILDSMSVENHEVKGLLKKFTEALISRMH